MIALIVIGIIVLAVLLISLIRIGSAVEYSESGLMVRIKAGSVKITVFPRKQKEDRRPKKKAAKVQQPEKETSEKKGGSFDLVRQFLPLVTDAAARIRKTIRIDVLHLDFISAAPDPAAAAMAFGSANAALGMVIPPLEECFDIRDRRIRTAVDFNAAKPSIYILAQVTLTVGQAVRLVATLGVRCLKIYMAYRKAHPGANDHTPKKQKEAV